MIKYIMAFSALLALQNLDAYIFSQPPHQNIPSLSLKFDHILSFNEDFRSQIINYARSFPANEYDVHIIPDLGAFWLEKKSDSIKDMLKREEKWEPHIEEYIKKYTKPGSTAIDIGAHIGTQTVWMSRAVGENGKVIAIEPQPKFFRELFMNLELNSASNVYYFWGAISTQAGTIKLPNLKDTCEVVSLLDTTTGYSEFNAPTGTLDSLELKNVSLIKIDVDGMEDAVLDGILETVISNKPVIIIEIQGSHSIETAPPEVVEKILHTKNMLIDLGYTLQRISGIDYLCLPGEKPIQKPITVPAPTEKPTQTSNEKPSEKQAEKQAEKIAPTPSEKPTQISNEKPSEKQAGKIAPTPSEKPAQKPAPIPVSKPSEKINFRR